MNAQVDSFPAAENSRQALHFVFLQGMPSPFFSRIGQILANMGCRVTGVNFCFGDQWFWRGPARVNYRGRLADWPRFLERYFRDENVTDIVLLGEQRSYHKLAVETAHACGVRVTVTDFGYLRPDWITLEQDGMSGNSRFPKDPATIRSLAAGVPPVDDQRRYSDSALNMSLNDLAYSFGNVLLWWLYPHYRSSYRRPHPLIYFPAMGRQLLLRSLRKAEPARRIDALLAAKKPFYVFPLQLEHDFQIVSYSPFASLGDAIRTVLRSFAQHAPADAELVIKVHPWDPGLKNWRKLIAAMVGEFGLGDRVVYLDGGSLDLLTEFAAGMVTVNSTSGVRALQLGCPVIALGEAIYDIPGLADQGELDLFWSHGQRPDSILVDDFIRAMAGTIQVRGVFFSEPGLTAAVTAASQRLYEDRVGKQLLMQDDRVRSNRL